ncbi:MAG: amidohydrolase family protein [Bacteroidota bacterium]|jgi:imidazolonepropionase-like amidohydrolase
MNNYLLIFVLCLVYNTTFLVAHDEIPGAAQKNPIILKNAKIYTVSKGIIDGGMILFDKGKIVSVGKNIDIPIGAEIIDCTGKSVYPGFIASESTIGLVEIEAVRATRDAVETGIFNPNAKSVTAYNPDSEIIPTIRSNGILIAHVVPQGGLISGLSSIMQLDGWTREDIALKHIAALSVNIPSMSVQNAPWISKSAEEQIKDNEKNLLELRDYFTKAKMYSLAAKNGLADNMQDIRLESMRPIFEKQLPVFFTASSKQQILAALDMAKTYGINAIIFGANEAHLCIEELQLARVPVIIPRTHSLPREAESAYDEPYTLPHILERAGILWSFSESSFWQQRNLPFNAGTAIAYGLSEEAALRGLTINPATILGIADRVGSLDSGKDATLFVSKGNALDGLTNNVEYAFIQGKVVSLQSRQTELAKKYRTRYQQGQ